MEKRAAKRWLLIVVAAMGYALGLPVIRFVLRKFGADDLRVLTYHSISRLRTHETNVSPRAFDEQMRILRRKADVVDLAELFAPSGGNGSSGRPRVAVTFDDGYADNLENAAPIVRKHGLAATCFITAAYVGTDERLPHDREEAGDGTRLLSWREVGDLRDFGVAVGSHGLRHKRLAALPAEEVEREIAESKRLLERHLRAPVQVFSYPYGRAPDYDRRAVQAVANAGYRLALTAKYGWNRRNTHPFEMKRIGIESSDTPFTFRAKLNGALDLLALCESRFARRVVALFNLKTGVSAPCEFC